MIYIDINELDAVLARNAGAVLTPELRIGITSVLHQLHHQRERASPRGSAAPAVPARDGAEHAQPLAPSDRQTAEEATRCE